MLDRLMLFIENLVESTQDAWNFLTTPISGVIVKNFFNVEIIPLEILSVGALSALCIYYLIRGLTI